MTNKENIKGQNWNIEFKYLIVNACGRDSTVVEVNVGNQPTANAGINQTINCPEKRVILRGSPKTANTGYEWKNPTRTVQTDSMPTTEGGIHTFTTTDLTSNCKASSTVFVTLDIEPPVITGVNTTAAVCSNSTDGAIEISTSGGVLFKLDGGIFRNSNLFTGLKGGDYKVVIQGRNFCEASQAVTVKAPPVFKEKIKFPDCRYFVGTEVRFELQEEGGVRMATTPFRYAWTTTPSKIVLSCQNCPNPRFKIKDTMSFRIRLVATDNKGCTASDSLVFDKIRENLPPDIITPNGDGNNDKLIFSDLDCGATPVQFPNNEITIVNRWGEVVFKMKDYDNSWDGSNQNGQPLPEGTYYYILRLNLSDGRIYRNNVLIIR